MYIKDKNWEDHFENGKSRVAMSHTFCWTGFQAFQISLLMFDAPLKQDYKDKVGEDPTKHFTDEELKERDRHWRGNLGKLSWTTEAGLACTCATRIVDIHGYIHMIRLHITVYYSCIQLFICDFIYIRSSKILFANGFGAHPRISTTLYARGDMGCCSTQIYSDGKRVESWTPANHEWCQKNLHAKTHLFLKPQWRKGKMNTAMVHLSVVPSCILSSLRFTLYWFSLHCLVF